MNQKDALFSINLFQ